MYCVNSYYVKNPYSGQTILVNCGHCPACLQYKADKRSARIRNNMNSYGVPKYRVWFLTLTYDNKFIPYIKKDQLLEMMIDREVPINVYRDYDCRIVTGKHMRTKNGKRATLRRKLVRNTSLLDTLFYDDFQYRGKEIDYVKLLNNDLPSNYLREWITSKSWKYVDKQRIPVLWYKDIQNYIKRVKKEFNKHEISFSYFCCTEYGPTSGRPHAHILAFVPMGYDSLTKYILCKNWLFDFHTSRKCEIPRKDIASYVSSYVNGFSSLPYLFQAVGKFAPKHSYSFGFGMENENFRLEEVLAKVRRGSLLYARQVIANGVSTRIDIPLPKYALNRYFPVFRGYSRFTDDEIRSIIIRPERFAEIAAKYEGWLDRAVFLKLVHQTEVSLRNHYLRYCNLLNIPVNLGTCLQYAQDFLDTWKCYKNTMYRFSYADYDNTPLFLGKHFDFNQSSIDPAQFFGVDVPQKFRHISTHPAFIAEQVRLERRFAEKNKDRKRINAIDSYYINV